MAKVTEDDLIRKLITEATADRPQEGEYTSTTFRERWKAETGETITRGESDGILERWVKEGKCAVRHGHEPKGGRPCKIYKPI